ncbi:MAG: type II toxin-antitoxin system RelE/ParE family toxin [Thauera sp.]|nr:type II toxin-antitoxin system RelE/ParE family toxin [Thauera sp.]
MRRILFRPQARAEFDAAGDWYEAELRGLGEAFLDAVEAQLSRIATNPLLYPAVYRDVRKAALKRFPYCIYFRLRGDTVVVLAVFHTSRNPESWKRRN